MNNRIIYLLAVLTINVTAQVNIEKYRTPEDLRGIGGYLEISGTIQSGNAEKTEGALDARLDWKTAKTTTFFVFKSNHEWIDGDRLSSEGLLHIRNVIGLIENLSSEIFGQINYDKKILVDDRELIGAGLRFKILGFEKSDVTFGTSYMFEHEKYNLPNNWSHHKEVNVSRWSNYLSLFLEFGSHAHFGGVIYYQPVINTFTDFRILSENTLNVSLTQLLSLSLNSRFRYDSDPPDGIKKTDAKTDFGIVLKF